MANNIPDMVKITLDTSRMQDFDESGTPLGTYKGVLKDLDSDLSAFERVIKSASNYFEYFNNNLKKINTSTGLAEQSFFVRREELDNVLSAIRGKNAERFGDEGGYNYTVSNIETIKASRKILGKDAQKKAIEEINRLGGTAVVNPKNKDKLDIYLPVESSSVVGLTGAQKSAIITQAIPEARKLSRIEGKHRRQEELEIQHKEEEKRTAEEVKLVAERKKAEDKAKKEADKLLAEAEDKAEKEAYRKAEENQKAEEAKIKESSRKTGIILKAILTVVTVIGDVVRRILTASLKQASENTKMATEAHDVGVTALERRGYDIFDIAHGMEKGSTFGAIKSVQGMFGDVTALDEKALGTLARVMGSEVGEAVRSGMGGQNPDQLLEKIMDKYFKQYLSGRNSLGQQVGMEQARRELVTSLQSISPEIARLFSQMADDYASGYYNFSSYAGWKGTTATNRSGMTEATRNFSNEIGKKYNEILAIVEELKTSFFDKLGNNMDDLLIKVKNIRVGQSEANKIAEDTRNREANTRSKEIMQTQLSLYSSTSQDRVNEIMKRTPLGKGQAGYFTYTTELLAGIKSGVYDADYFKKVGLGGTGMISQSQVKAYIARGKVLADEALFDPKIKDEMARSMTNIERIQEIEKSEAYLIGSGKIADLSMSAKAQDYKAQEILTSHARSIAGRPGVLSEAGENMQLAVLDAYLDFLMTNPETFKAEEKTLTKSGKAKYQNIARNIAKENKIHLEDLSYAQKAQALAIANAENWYALNFAPSVYSATKGKAEDTFLMRNVVESANRSINEGDSKILSRLAEHIFNPNATYSVYGQQGRSGEYVLKVQMLDSSGRATGAPIDINLADTKGTQGNLGTVTTNDKGQVMWASTY